ncbi:MAG: HEAT repeat domain-containing protein [Candidatus Hydrogenedentota bacterium]
MSEGQAETMDWNKNRELLQNLASLKTTDAYQYLLELWDKGDTETRALSLKYLAWYDSAAVRNIFELSCSDKEPLLRKTALFILRLLPDYNNQAIYFKALSDNDNEVVREAIQGLKRFDTEESLNAILRFVKDKDETLVEAALESLMGKKNIRILNEVFKILPTASEKVRILSIRLLASYADLKLLDAMKRLWTTATLAEKVSIIDVISKIDDIRSLDFLLEVFNTKEKIIKIAVLRKINRATSHIIKVFIDEMLKADELFSNVLMETVYRLIKDREELIAFVINYYQQIKNIKVKKGEKEKEETGAPDGLDLLGKEIKNIMTDIKDKEILGSILDFLKSEQDIDIEGLKQKIYGYLEMRGKEDKEYLFSEIFNLRYKWQKNRLFNIIIRDIKEKKIKKEEYSLLNYAKLLGKLKSKEGVEILIDIYTHTIDENEKIVILQALSNIEDIKVTDFFMRLYQITVNIEERKEILIGLGKLKNKDSLKIIIKALTEPDPDIRYAACLSISNFEEESKILHLKRCLKDDDKKIRATAVTQLGLLKDRRLLDEFLKLLKDEDPRVCANAIEAIERTIVPIIDKNKVVISISPLLESDNNRVKGNACKLLYQFMAPECYKILQKMASSDDKWMRATAAWVCGQVEDVKALRLAGFLLQDPEARVKTDAVKSLISQTKDELKKEAFRIILGLGEKGMIEIEKDIDEELETETQKYSITSVLKSLRDKQEQIK